MTPATPEPRVCGAVGVKEPRRGRRLTRGASSSGAVWPEADVDSQTIPLEAGLWDLVSFHKGCYIGQEVIARMESRNRLARRMAGLRLDGPVAAPQEILRGATSVGLLTTAAVSPTLGSIGLGLVRSAVVDEAPCKVSLSPSGRTGTIHPLPLVSDSP